jgi:hypothetical protein
MKIIEVVQAYHGSAIEPSRFRAAHGGSNSHTFGPYQSTRWGTFFTDNPEFARLYGTSREYRLNLRNTVDLDHEDIRHQFAKTLDAFDPAQRDLWIAATYSRHIWSMFEDRVGYAFTRFLRRLGYDSARFTEYNEDDDGNELMSHTIVVFNPTRIGR